MSEWIIPHVHGRVCARTFCDSEKEVIINTFKKYNIVPKEDAIKLFAPNLELIFSQIRTDPSSYNGDLHTYNFEYNLLGCEGKGYVFIPILPFTPYGSEGTPQIHVMYAPDDPGIRPLNGLACLKFIIDIYGGIRDRNQSYLPYVRLWWRLLNIWLDFDAVTATVSYGMEGFDDLLNSYRQSEDGDFDNRALSDALTLIAFLDVCEEYNEAHTKVTFSEWYCTDYVPKNGEIIEEVTKEFEKLKSKNG